MWPAEAPPLPLGPHPGPSPSPLTSILENTVLVNSSAVMVESLQGLMARMAWGEEVRGPVLALGLSGTRAAEWALEAALGFKSLCRYRWKNRGPGRGRPVARVTQHARSPRPCRILSPDVSPSEITVLLAEDPPHPPSGWLAAPGPLGPLPPARPGPLHLELPE